MSFEYLIISVSEERKTIMIKQIHDLKLKAPFSFLPNPATISTISDYIKDSPYLTHGYQIRSICCGLSHYRAIEYACKSLSSEYVVILEDDVAIHKTQFENGINEIISKWDTFVAPKKIASIGWIPCRNYSAYLTATAPNSLICIPGSKLLIDRYVPGLQAYIIKRIDFISCLHDLIHPTHETFKKHIIEKAHPAIDYKDVIMPVDMILNRLYGAVVMFPLLAIEQETPSIIDNADSHKDLYWKPFFKNYEAVRDDYYKPS